MASTPHKPNPLHGKPEVTVTMPGEPPEVDMEPKEAAPAGVSEATKAEQEAGRVALSTHTDRLTAEQDAGRAVLTRYAKHG